MFIIEKEPFAVWFSTSSRHHFLAGSAEGAKLKPKKYPEGSPCDYPSELFETIDFNLKGTKFEDTFVYQELCKRGAKPQEALMRLRPFLPIPYLSDFGLEPPLLAIPYYELLIGNPPSPLAFVTQQIFKTPDFMIGDLPRILQDKNCGPVGITLNQMDSAGLTLRSVTQMNRSRPLVIVTEGLPSSLKHKLVQLEANDILSMKAQVSLLKWVARKTYEVFRYQDPITLAPIYSSLWYSDPRFFEDPNKSKKLSSFVDPFELEDFSRPLKLGRR